MYELKTYGAVMCYNNEGWCKIWKGIDLPVQNSYEEFNKFWTEHSKISIICTLMSWFWPKCIMFQLRKYRRVMFHDTQDWYKVWKKTDWCFEIWHKKFGKFSPEHLKVSKLGPWASFCQKLKMYELENYKGVMCLGSEEWCKISWKTNLCFLKWSLKNNDFILESKIVELNKNKNSKQPDRPVAVQKLYLEIN